MPLETLKEIPTGYRGTAETIKVMKRLVEEDARKYAIIKLASDIVAHVPERDQWAEPAAILLWVQTNIRFVRDPYNMEMVQAPEYTIDRRAGDCDDMSTLFNCLCKCIGYDTAFKTIKADPRIPTDFSHVYPLVGINGKWVPADPSQKGKPLGWEPPRHNGAMVWGYSRGTLQNREEKPAMTGLSGLDGGGIEQRIIGWFRARRAAAAPATAAAPAPAASTDERIPNGRIPTSQLPDAIEVVADDSSRRDMFFDEGAGEPYDPDDVAFFGSYGGETPPGNFGVERFETLDGDDQAENDLSPVTAPVSGGHSFEKVWKARAPRRLAINRYDPQTGLNLSVRQQRKLGT